jgi:hypothetical protein
MVRSSALPPICALLLMLSVSGLPLLRQETGRSFPF